jgi:hypothetical protein
VARNVCILFLLTAILLFHQHQAFLEAIKTAASIRTCPQAPSFASIKLTALGKWSLVLL